MIWYVGDKVEINGLKGVWTIRSIDLARRMALLINRSSRYVHRSLDDLKPVQNL